MATLAGRLRLPPPVRLYRRCMRRFTFLVLSYLSRPSTAALYVAVSHPNKNTIEQRQAIMQSNTKQTPRVYLYAFDLELSSPMESLYDDFPRLQQNFRDPNDKILYYTYIIESLVGRLKTLQQNMCTSCKKKRTLSLPAPADRSFPVSNDSTLTLRPLRRRDVEDHIPALPRIAELDSFWPTSDPSSSSLPIFEMVVDSDSDGEILSTQFDGLAVANSAVDATFMHSFCHKLQVSCVRFSRDGRYLAAATGYKDDTSITIYEVESHEKYRELREYATGYGVYKRGVVWSMCFSFDGRYLAVGDSSSRIIIWDVANKRIRSIFHGIDTGDYEIEQFSEVHFSPDGRLVAFHTDMGPLILNVRDNSRKIMMGNYKVYLDFSPNGRYIVTGDHDTGELVILDVRTGGVVKSWNSGGGHRHQLYQAKFSLDGRRLVCVYYPRAIGYWDLNDQFDAKLVLYKEFESDDYTTAVISPDNGLLALSNGELWSVDGDSNCILKLKLCQDSAVTADFSPVGTYLALGSEDTQVTLWKYCMLGGS